MLNDIYLSKLVECARQNWEEWRAVFEHDGPANTNPLLISSERFGKFCKEYGVSRTIRRHLREERR